MDMNEKKAGSELPKTRDAGARREGSERGGKGEQRSADAQKAYGMKSDLLREPAFRRAPTSAPLVEKAPGEPREQPAPKERGDAGFKPIGKLLPVWVDGITGKALSLEELRKALLDE